MYVIIEIYIIVCIMLLLFNLFFILTKNSRLRRLHPQKDKLRNMLMIEFELYTPQAGLSANATEFLSDKLTTTQSLMVLEKEMKKRRPYREELKEEIKPYVFSHLEQFKQKNKYEQAYYAYVLSCFEYQNDSGNEIDYATVLPFLDSKHLYVFTNTMDVIYKFADPYVLLAAIQKVDERSGFYHSKLLTDGLLTFEGDLEAFQSMLIEKFHGYTPLTQVSLVNYFRLKDLAVDDFCLSLIKERTVDDEVVYAAMRYFGRNPNEEAKKYFIDVLKKGDSFWIEELLAIQALKNYDDPETRSTIKKKVTSRNWEVRSNAISYLHKHELKLNDVMEILDLKDKYTNEKLYYYYEEDEEIAPHIIESLEEIAREASELEANSADLVK